MARLDRIFVSTDWEANFPLTRVKALERIPSDHNTLLMDIGASMDQPKKNSDLKSGGQKKRILKR
jgi:hypothetical protein